VDWRVACAAKATIAEAATAGIARIRIGAKTGTAPGKGG